MKKAGFVFSLVAALFILGCGQPTTLVSMSITPASMYQIGIGGTAQYQFTAYGNFTHPTETRDITKEVTWTSAVTGVGIVDNKGTVTPSYGCGVTTITATAGKDLIGGRSDDSQAKMIATATFTVAVANDPSCPAPPTS